MTDVKIDDLTRSMRLLLTMVEAEIKRGGSEAESFMVRSGLLRDILKLALSAQETIHD